MSSKRSAFRRRSTSRMPEDSSWNTPTVSARASISKVLESSSGMVLDLEVRFPLANQLAGPGQHRQGLEAQEVELHQAGLLDELHVELGDRHVGARVAVERHQLLERPVADHHAGGMGRGVAVEPLQLERDVDQAGDGLVAVARISCKAGSPSIACCR